MLARRRTKVHRVAKFVRSIKHSFLYFYSFRIKNSGFCKIITLTEPLVLFCFMRSALFYITLFLHCRKVTVVDKLDAVSFKVLFCSRVFHNLVFPYSALPAARCAFEVIGFK